MLITVQIKGKSYYKNESKRKEKQKQQISEREKCEYCLHYDAIQLCKREDEPSPDSQNKHPFPHGFSPDQVMGRDGPLSPVRLQM